MRRALSTVLLALTCLLGLAASASAHALLESSNPARGAQLSEAPARVTFTFNEPVEGSLGAVRVFDTEGNQVQSGELDRPGGKKTKVGVKLPSVLPDGLYTATYRVVSADAHPISGGITFTVGKPGGDPSRFASEKTISELLADSEAGRVTEVGFWLIRWLGYLALAIGIGLLAWILKAWRGPETTVASEAAMARRFRRLLLATILVGLFSSLMAIPFQGAIAAGTSLWEAFGSGIPNEVIHTRFGTMMLIRSAAWLALIPLVFAPARRLVSYSAEMILALAGGAVIAVTPALAGHASTRDPGWLTVPSDVLHVAAMAIWSGGLVAMVSLLPVATRQVESRSARTRLLTRVTRCFSAMAFTVAIVVGVTGAIQAIVDVGSVPDLFNNAFGRAVTIKIVLFVILIGLGWANRDRIIPALVRRMEAGESPGGPGMRLRRVLRIEALLVVCVLGVSAALVSYPPPDSIQAGPTSGAVTTGPDRIEYTVDPGQVGSNEIHVYVFNDRTGAPVPVISIELAFSMPESQIDPIEVEARRAGPGHFVVPNATFGVRGTWRADAAVRVSTFTERQARFDVEIK